MVKYLLFTFVIMYNYKWWIRLESIDLISWNITTLFNSVILMMASYPGPKIIINIGT